MNILMLSDVYFPRVNGVSTSIATFRRELDALGHRVHLIAPAYPGASDDEPGITRVAARYLFADPEDRMMRRGRVLSLTGTLAAQDFDIIHIQTPFIAHHAGVRLSRRLGIPRVETYHTFFEEYLYHYLPWVPSALTRFAARRFSAMQCNDLDGLVVPSTAMAERLRVYGVHVPTRIIPTGVDTLNPAGDGAAFRRDLGIAADRPTLVHVGRIAHEKNIDFLLHMLDRVRREIPEVLLIVAGEGPALRHLKQLGHRLGLDGHLRFVGYLDRRQTLADCYRAADAFVFASRTETQGLVLLEALSLGVPVVSTAIMGTRDILTEQGGGALVAEDDLTDYSAKVIAVLRDPQLRAKLAAEGPAYAEQWNAAAQARRLAGFYSDIIHHNAATDMEQPAVGSTPH